jgi:hypothetical protein
MPDIQFLFFSSEIRKIFEKVFVKFTPLIPAIKSRAGITNLSAIRVIKQQGMSHFDNWAEGTFSFTTSCKDAKDNLEITDGFFRIPVEK